jgi:hypothetical protein
MTLCYKFPIPTDKLDYKTKKERFVLIACVVSKNWNIIDQGRKQHRNT